MRGHREAPNNPPEATRPSRLLSYKHPALLSPLECALTESPTTVHSKRLTQPDKSFRMRSYEKTRGVPPHAFPPSRPLFTPKGTDWDSLSTRQSPIACSLFLQRLTNCPICKPFVSTTMQQCRGCGGPKQASAQRKRRAALETKRLA